MMDELPDWDEQSLLPPTLFSVFLPCVPISLSHHNLQPCSIQSFNTFNVALGGCERWFLTTDYSLFAVMMSLDLLNKC